MTETANELPTGIHTALAAAQKVMGPAIRQSLNPHLKNKYADLASVMDACMEALNDHGIAVMQAPGQDEHGLYVETRFLHSSGEVLSCRVPLIVDKQNMQGYGSAVTYARRYGLMCMAGIAPEDDDGNAAAAAPPKQQKRAQGTMVTKAKVETGAESEPDRSQTGAGYPITTTKGEFVRPTLKDWENQCMKMLAALDADNAYMWREMNVHTIMDLQNGSPDEQKAAARVVAVYDAKMADAPKDGLEELLDDEIPESMKG